MKCNTAGREIIQQWESCRLHAYRCPAGKITIGYGHTGPELSMGLTIDQERANLLLEKDLAIFEMGVTKALGSAPTTWNQFSAMVSLAFNIGVGAFRTSSVLRHHLAGNYQGAADSFRLFNKGTVHGRKEILPGLVKRREEERRLYLREEVPVIIADADDGERSVSAV